MSKIKLTDANNVVFEMDMESITRLTDDLSSPLNAPFISDSETSVNQIAIEKTIVNADGSDFSITDSEEDMSQISSIDVYFEASHSNTIINNSKYTDNSMLRDAESYLLPYGKPMLRHHNDHSGEPIGRIKNSQCIDSVALPGTKALDIKSNITDRDAIVKFLDGRYNTVSIGAYPKTITCNHCGKSILKDGKFNFCGHFRGQVYEDKKCTWTMEDLEYSELSVVNTPADRYAQAYRIVVNKKKAKEADSESGEKTANSLSDDILGAISEPEQIINNNDDNADGQEADNNANDNAEPIVTDDNQDNSQEPEISDSELDTLKSKVADLEQQLSKNISDNDSLREQVEVLTADNEFLNNKNEKLTGDLEAISNSYKKDLLNVVNRFSNNIQEDISFKELKKAFNGLEYKPTQPKLATNPSLVNTSSDKNVIEDTEATKVVAKNNNALDCVISVYSN